MPNKAIDHLKKDSKMSRLIDKYEVNIPEKSTNLFLDLVETIVSQQLSIKAADTIFSRFSLLFPDRSAINPFNILAQDSEKLRQVGLSRQKISYLQSLSAAIKNKELDLEILDTFSDEEVILQLTKVKGIGRWTAEMFLMFSLGRPDIFSFGDQGLKNALKNIYSIDEDDLKSIEEVSLSWAPFRTHAALYLWKSLENT